MISITPGSHAFRLISMLLIVGEFPFQGLGLIGDARTLKALAVKMSQPHEVQYNHKSVSYNGRILLISGSGRYKTIRLYKWFFPVLEKYFHDAYRYYLFEHPNHNFHSERNKIERNHRVAEALSFMLLSGIESRPYKTPTLQRMTIDRKPYLEPAYYSSRMVKSLVDSQLQKTQYTRYVGILLYQTGYYVIYNSRKAVMRWNGEGEQKTTLDVSNLCSMNCESTGLRSAILLGYDYQVAMNTINQYESGSRYVKLFSQNYHRIHFIPMTEEGIKMLQILVVPNWQHRILHMLFEEEQIRLNTGSFQFDALVDDTRVLCFMDCDILKLISFYKAARESDFSWSVVCYDSQVEFLRSYLGDTADLRSFDLNDFHKEMEANRKALL